MNQAQQIIFCMLCFFSSHIIAMEVPQNSDEQLFSAINHNRTATLERLLKIKAYENGILNQALAIAVKQYSDLSLEYRNDYLCIIKKLVAKGASVNIKYRVWPMRSLLMEATRAYNGNELVNYLLSCGANFNFQDARGRTALIEAADFANIDAVHSLLAYHADISLLCEKNNTALDYAYNERSYKKEEANKVISLLKKNN